MLSSTKAFIIVSYLLQNKMKCASLSTAVLTDSQMLREFRGRMSSSFNS